MTFRGLVAAVAATLIVAPNASAQSQFIGNDAAFSTWATANSYSNYYGIGIVNSCFFTCTREIQMLSNNNTRVSGVGPVNSVGLFIADFKRAPTTSTFLSFPGGANASSYSTGNEPLNTLVLRTTSGANLGSMVLNFYADGSSVSLSGFGGAVAHVVFRDQRLAGGFRISGSASVPDGSVQFRVGNSNISVPSNVPEPGTFALLGVGLTGLALVARRRSNA